MSWQACEWLDSLPYDISERLEQRILLKLCNVADQNGERAFRSKSEMARELGCDPKSVQRSLRKLEVADLIRLGDQELVSHLRGGYRPTVYNMNFGWHRIYAQPELPHPEPENEGGHQGGHGYPQSYSGGTSEGTSQVPLGTRELLNSNYQEDSYVGNRAQAHEMDASGAPTSPLTRWSVQQCPGDWRDQTHQLGSAGTCLHCYERPTITKGVRA